MTLWIYNDGNYYNDDDDDDGNDDDDDGALRCSFEKGRERLTQGLTAIQFGTI